MSTSAIKARNGTAKYRSEVKMQEQLPSSKAPHQRNKVENIVRVSRNSSKTTEKKIKSGNAGHNNKNKLNNNHKNGSVIRENGKIVPPVESESTNVNNNNEGEEEFNSMLTYDIISDDNDVTCSTGEQKTPTKKGSFLSRIFGHGGGKTEASKNSCEQTCKEKTSMRVNSKAGETRLPTAKQTKLQSMEDVRHRSSSAWNTFPRSVSTIDINASPTFIPVFKRSSLNIFESFGFYPSTTKRDSPSLIPRLYTREVLEPPPTNCSLTATNSALLHFVKNSNTVHLKSRSKTQNKYTKARAHHSEPHNRSGRHRRSLPNFLEQFAECEGK